MYATRVEIYGLGKKDPFLNQVYKELSHGYKVPDISTILDGIEVDVSWPNQGEEVYLLDDLKEERKNQQLLVRYPYSSAESSRLTEIFISVQDKYIQCLTFIFPYRAGKMGLTRIIDAIKMVSVRVGIPFGDIKCDIQGFPEWGLSKLIREQSIRAFRWLPEPKADGGERYFHPSEIPYMPR